MVEDLVDPRRTEPPYVLPERQMLEGWLEYHRVTLLLKCEGLDDADWDADLAAWQAECEASRAAAAQFDLDHTGLRRGEEVSLRWIYNHMIEEYARHNGHADLIRELIDGAVGY
ncbi:MAG: DUF664 domain-containing protein [Acidimicrobiia bacterium]|nr:DUF664 domain-containing protein [Acidimicrobiia bacterium]